MLEKLGQAAEQVVSQVRLSRRGFLGRAAQLAAGLGAALATLGAVPTEAQAGGKWQYPQCWCGSDLSLRPVCVYQDRFGRGTFYTAPTERCTCPKEASTWTLSGKYVGRGCLRRY